MPRIKGLKQGLAGALALGAVAAMPTVIASSQEQQGIAPWQPSSGGSGGAAGGAGRLPAAAAVGGPAASASDWSLSRVLEEVLQQVRQLAIGVSGADEEAGSERAEADWGDELPASGHAEEASSLGLVAGASASVPHAPQQQPQQHSRRQHRLGRDFLSARRVAAEHPEEVRQLRQLALAELARLRAEDNSGSSSSSSAAAQTGRRQQASARGGLQQQPAAPPPPLAEQQQQPGQGQLPARFTDAELVRFAIMQGLLQAASPAERAVKLQEGAAAAARTALWLERHPFSSDDELHRFKHLVRWEGPDAAGRPILRVLIGAAVTECRGNAALAFANAILTHMEQGVSSRLHDDPPQPEPAGSGSGSGSSSSSGDSVPSPLLQFVISQPAESSGLGQRSSPNSGSSGNGSNGGSDCSSCGDPLGVQVLAAGPASSSRSPAAAPAAAAAAAAAVVPQAESSAMPSCSPEQIVVLMDCRGASTLNAARISWVFKAVASSLSHHYPGRLHELVLLDLPVVLGWMVKGVKQLLHPDTRHKFRVVHAGHETTAQQAQQELEQAAAAAADQAPQAAAEAPHAGKPLWSQRGRAQHAQQAQQQQPAADEHRAEQQAAGPQQAEQQQGEQDGWQHAATHSQPEVTLSSPQAAGWQAKGTPAAAGADRRSA